MGKGKHGLNAIDGLSFGEKLFIRHGYKKLLKLIEENYGNKKDLRILDIGCGPGVFADELGKKGRLYGLDICHASMISEKWFNKVCGDAAFMPFRDDSFDVVISRSSFGYWKDKKKSIDEIKRVLKPHHHLLITDIKKTKSAFFKHLLIFLDVLLVGSLRKITETSYAIDTRCDPDEVKRLMASGKIEFQVICGTPAYFTIVGKNLK
ncbi:hypothetical protein COV19_04140 [Candidatus Woesearchaeota archaeon CG10_big_fil_rev_8_21_14_0_10_44_13]|nr:MAG: hypothetical protein COV19_04140 [Candidatus Woesearchaeota archaeon CG10_big_fil_rev_8_21_14_0_10_44_13]